MNSNKKSMGIIAHHADKKDLVEWVMEHQKILENVVIYATSETGHEIENHTHLKPRREIELKNNYPTKIRFKESQKGGDQEIGSLLIKGELDYFIYFWNALSTESHDNDIKAVLRQSVNHDVPTACNKSTANYLITSSLFDRVNSEYEKQHKDLTNITLVAHDGKKKEMLEWVKKNRDYLKGHNLFATGTTGKIINDQAGLKVTRLNSGPRGGDMQISTMISNKFLDYLFFFWDPETAHPHDVDVKALLRIAVLYDLPTACNLSTSNHLITSYLFPKKIIKKHLKINP